jgi:hypothetical protein
MAIVDHITGENIERFRGIIDFYMLRGRLPVARKWPNKPKPPYTALQAEAMAVFSLYCAQMKRLETDILTAWKIGSEGLRAQWTDTFKGLGMKYWKLKKVMAPIALEYEIIDTGDTFKVKWTVLQVFLDPEEEETITDLETELITKADLEKTNDPVFFTLYDDEGNRLIAPFILFVG